MKQPTIWKETKDFVEAANKCYEIVSKSCREGNVSMERVRKENCK